jgi:hypothetical protein
MRAFGRIYGCLFAVASVGGGVGPFLMGLSYDRTGGYGAALAGFVTVLCASCVLASRLGPYVFAPAQPEQVGPDRESLAEAALISR